MIINIVTFINNHRYLSYFELRLVFVYHYLFILDPSFSRSPHAPVFTALSEPAKSTNDILLTFSPLTPLSKSVKVCVSTTVKTAWDLKYDM